MCIQICTECRLLAEHDESPIPGQRRVVCASDGAGVAPDSEWSQMSTGPTSARLGHSSAPEQGGGVVDPGWSHWRRGVYDDETNYLFYSMLTRTGIASVPSARGECVVGQFRGLVDELNAPPLA